MPKPLREQATLIESVDKKTGKILVNIITPGLGSSGYYSPEVCEAAAGLVTAGTKMFLDHPTDTDVAERPGRSVKDIAAVFTESARWDPDRGEAGALVAEARVVPSWIETMEVIQGAIGVSIYGSATDIVEGDVDGRRLPIVEGLHAIDSVDFVTRPGRGGAFALMESANPANVRARVMARGVSESTANDTRETLQTVVRDAYGGEKTYVWVRDFDPDPDVMTVWFEIEAPEGDDSGIFAQTYTDSDGAVALTGDRTEVRVSTTYVPVTRPDSNTPTATESEEDTMPKIQIEEAVHNDLTEKAGRVDVLESENATLKAKNTQLEEARAADQRRTRAMDLIREHEHGFSPLEAKGLVAELPLTESGDFDEEAFGTQLSEHAAAVKAAAGEGKVSSFGQTTDTTATESAPVPAKTAWGRPVSEQKGA